MINYGTIKRNGSDTVIRQYEGENTFLEIEAHGVCHKIADGFFTKEEAIKLICIIDADDSFDELFMETEDYNKKMVEKLTRA